MWDKSNFKHILKKKVPQRAILSFYGTQQTECTGIKTEFYPLKEFSVLAVFKTKRILKLSIAYL